MKEKYLDMKDNLIDIIKEEQAKLGYRKESIRLYYPLGSLKHLLKADADIEKMREVLDDFCDEVKEFFGQIEVTNNGERFCFKVPDAGVEYVHENMAENEFICGLVKLVSGHGCTFWIYPYKIIEFLIHACRCYHKNNIRYGTVFHGFLIDMVDNIYIVQTEVFDIVLKSVSVCTAVLDGCNIALRCEHSCFYGDTLSTYNTDIILWCYSHFI